MGINISRMTDLTYGVCTSHSPSPITTNGIILTGSPNVMVNGIGVAGLGDIVLGFCGHIGIIISGSGSVMVNGKGCSRLQDLFHGSYSGYIITGSADVFAG
jgi:uncharacterized Zn-binding protein involved in type VI secretion